MTPNDSIGQRDGLPIREWYAAAERPKPIRDRFAKLEKLRDLGVPAYSYSFDPTDDLTSALASYEDGVEGTRVRVAGRLVFLGDALGIDDGQRLVCGQGASGNDDGRHSEDEQQASQQ